MRGVRVGGGPVGTAGVGTGAIGGGNRELQQLGETAAARHLERRGLRILARNWRIRMGELDLVARDGGTLVFVEVKTRVSGDFVDPALGVDGRKRRQLRRLAEAYLAMEHPRPGPCRFDVVSVLLGAEGPAVRHIVDAF
jgi:putative endonuclease